MAHLKHTTWQTQRGLTLVELMVTIAVIAILATTAVSTMSNMRAKQQVIAAAEEVASKLQRTKSLARKFTSDVELQMAHSSTGSTDYGLTGLSVVVSESGTVVDQMDFSLHASVRFKTNLSDHVIRFDHVRGMTTDYGSIFAEKTQGDTKYEARVVVGSSGRIRICSESNLSRYESCS